MKTLAERKFQKTGKLQRPSKWLPNGCGAGWTGAVVPDALAGVEFDDCCDLHDLAYYRGGFWGLFYRKPIADVKLGICMAKLFCRAGKANWDNNRKFVGLFQVQLGILAAPIYSLAVTLLGWPPFVWPWRKRPTPSREILEAVARALAD